MSATAEQVSDIFRQASGTSCYHAASLNKGIVITDSIKQLADAAGAYWLVDLIGSYNTVSFRKKYPFQVWQLTVEDKKGMMIMCEDTGQPVIVRQHIHYTDFPDGKWKFFCQYGDVKFHVLMSPGDY